LEVIRMGFEAIFNPIFNPLLGLPTIFAIIILSFIISLIMTLVYKFTTNQSLMKDLKSEMKEFQKQIKELKKEPERAMKVQKEAMQTNMKYMMHSMKSTLYSIIPIILIFSWMGSNFAYDPIQPGQDFTATISVKNGVAGNVELSAPDGIIIDGSSSKTIKDSKATWVLRGEEGEYLLIFRHKGIEYSKEVLISELKYYGPIKNVGEEIKSIEIGNTPRKVLNLFGWKLGWLGSYIIFSILFSLLIRKIIKVY
jgi:uncharacterized membrane protein (DUF106 family)